MSARVKDLLDRDDFLIYCLRPAKSPQIHLLCSSGHSHCALCRTSILHNYTFRTKAGQSFERAIQLPCLHIFGETCLTAYFSALKPNGSQLYNDTCPDPRCGRLLCTQDSAAMREWKEEIFEKEQKAEAAYRRRFNLVMGPVTIVMVVCILAAETAGIIFRVPALECVALPAITVIVFCAAYVLVVRTKPGSRLVKDEQGRLMAPEPFA
jgi:predicted nucleic acid-binding Zn ribbon protein